MLFKKLDTFSIFDQFVDDYKDKKILDFGGNRGNLLSYSHGAIKEENYTCLDVGKDALEHLASKHIDVNTIHWNRYHPTYNPDGDPNEPFPKTEHYDIVFANSVFTHMEINEMLYCLEELKSISDTVYFTYIDPANNKIFQLLQEKHCAIDLSEEQIQVMRQMKLSYILDKYILVSTPDREYDSIWSVIDTDHLCKLIGNVVSTGVTTSFNWMKIQN